MRQLARRGRQGWYVDGLVGSVQLAKDAAFGEQAGVPLRHLAAEDGFDAGGVGLVLPAGEGEDARAAVLDGDGCVEQRGSRVGQGEQVAGGHAAEGFRLGDADVSVGEEGAEQDAELVPGGASGEREEGDAGVGDGGGDQVVGGDGGADDQAGRLLAAEVAQSTRR